METKNYCKIGGIFFFLGFNLQLISWYYSYPIELTDINIVTFYQFNPLLWPGIAFSLIGLFLVGYYSKKKSIQAFCTSLIPIMLFSYSFYFSYICSSDSGVSKAMFEIFHLEGINSYFVPYFQYPIKFTLDEITNQVLGIDINSLSVIFFALFGILLGLYLFLFLSKIAKNISSQVAFLGAPLYFTAIYSYLNYQWVPQTLALIFVFMLLFTFDQEASQYKLLSIVIFTALVFTHAFIPVIFLLFFGLYIIKKQEFRKIFILMTCIYISVLVYYTTFYFPIIVESFKETMYGFGEDYAMTVSNSFREPESLLSQIISSMNRIRIPITLLVVSIGSFIEFIKKRMSFKMIALGITGGFYVGLGLVYNVLGLRALQILFIPLVVGIGFYISRWKKLTLAFVFILLIIAVFGPMRAAYDHQQFQVDEEENACNFLANTMPTEQIKRLAISGINNGYFITKYDHLYLPKGYYLSITRITTGNQEFYHVFNASMKVNDYVLYNPNLGRQMMFEGANKEIVNTFKGEILLNNKIFECGKTFIMKGV